MINETKEQKCKQMNESISRIINKLKEGTYSYLIKLGKKYGTLNTTSVKRQKFCKKIKLKSGD